MGAHGPGERQPEGRAHEAPATPRLRVQTETQARPRYERLRILIVDDDFLFADMLPTLLRKQFVRPTLEIVSAKNPQDAFTHLATGAFDVILCDFDLRASQNGLHVLERVPSGDARPLRILITGHAPQDVPKDITHLYDAFLDKPATLRELLPLLAALLHELMGVELERRENAGDRI